MRRLLATGFGLVPAGLAFGVWACSGQTTGAAAPPGTDASDAGGDDSSLVDDALGLQDVQGSNCRSISFGVATDIDPVELCTQEQILGFMLQYAYQPGHGVASSWSSVSPFAAGSGHAWQDDVALAAAIGAFHCGADFYGDTAASRQYDGTMTDLATVLAGELATTPPGYDGADYFHMRGAAAAFNTIQMTAAGTQLNAGAEAYALSVVATSTGTVTPPPPVAEAGAPEAGADGGSAGGPSEAGVPAPATLIGSPNGDGTISYEPAKSIMAAAALLDMAARHASDVEAGADVAGWVAVAQGTLQYTWDRARDPGTGLFYASLTTSQDPGHDRLGATSPAPDALLTAVQGPVVLAYARAQAAAVQLSLSSSPYAQWGSALVASMSTLGLFDGPTMDPLDAGGVGTPPAPPGAFLEGTVPSLGVVLTNKPVRANALMLGGFVRVGAVTASPLAYENNGLRWALDEYAPGATINTVTWGPNKSFLSVVLDPHGYVVQQAHLSSTSRDWHLAQAAPDAGALPGASDYDTAANLAAIEGLTQIWTGVPNAPPCVY